VSRPKESRRIDGRFVAMTFIIAAVLFIFVGAGWSYLSCDGAPSRPAIRTFSADQQDCHHGAPDDCIRTTVEAAQRGDFRGYIFCACVYLERERPGLRRD